MALGRTAMNHRPSEVWEWLLHFHLILSCSCGKSSAQLIRFSQFFWDRFVCSLLLQMKVFFEWHFSFQFIFDTGRFRLATICKLEKNTLCSRFLLIFILYWNLSYPANTIQQLSPFALLWSCDFPLLLLLVTVILHSVLLLQILTTTAMASTEVSIDEEESDNEMVVVQSVPVAVQAAPQGSIKQQVQTGAKRKRKPTPPLPVELIRPPVILHEEKVIASMLKFLFIFTLSKSSLVVKYFFIF